MNIDNDSAVAKVKSNLKSEEAIVQYRDDEIDILAQNALTEY